MNSLLMAKWPKPSSGTENSRRLIIISMDLLLIEVRGTSKSINNGLAYLGGSLIGRHTFRIIDLNHLDWSDDRLKEFITTVNPKVLGLSVKSTNAAAVDKLIAELKSK